MENAISGLSQICITDIYLTNPNKIHPKDFNSQNRYDFMSGIEYQRILNTENIMSHSNSQFHDKRFCIFIHIYY